jgi:hypothetical protein
MAEELTTLNSPRANEEKLSLSVHELMEILRTKGDKAVIVGEIKPPIFFDSCDNCVYGNIFALDNNIFFLSTWNEDFLINVYVRLGELLVKEMEKRGIEIRESEKSGG